jgi:hypothetical protein
LFPVKAPPGFGLSFLFRLIAFQLLSTFIFWLISRNAFCKGIKLIFDMSPILLIQKVFYVSIATTNILVKSLLPSEFKITVSILSSFVSVKSCKCHHPISVDTTIITHVVDTTKIQQYHVRHHSINVFNWLIRLDELTGAAMEIHAPSSHHCNCSFGFYNQACSLPADTVDIKSFSTLSIVSS